ncbi:hypothetical protein DMH17_07030 [Raoultella planticola]|nr:hypothetical protein [Raoultella planticola]
MKSTVLSLPMPSAEVLNGGLEIQNGRFTPAAGRNHPAIPAAVWPTGWMAAQNCAGSGCIMAAE